MEGLCCLPQGVGYLVNFQRFGDRLEGTDEVNVFSWAEGMGLVIQVPLSFSIQPAWSNNTWQAISIWNLWHFQQVVLHLRCITLLLRCKDRPVEGRNDGAPILSWHQLSITTFCQLVDGFCNGLQAPNLCPPVLVLEQAKTPVRRKQWVPNENGCPIRRLKSILKPGLNTGGSKG